MPHTIGCSIFLYFFGSWIKLYQCKKIIDSVNTYTNIIVRQSRETESPTLPPYWNSKPHWFGRLKITYIILYVFKNILNKYIKISLIVSQMTLICMVQVNRKRWRGLLFSWRGFHIKFRQLFLTVYSIGKQIKHKQFLNLSQVRINKFNSWIQSLDWFNNRDVAWRRVQRVHWSKWWHTLRQLDGKKKTVKTL